MSARDHINLSTVLAAAIRELLGIPYEHAKLMSAEQMISLVHRDHFPIRRDDGLKLGMSVEEVDHHSNIHLRSIIEHREKTATVDAPAIAKIRDVRTSEAIHRAAMASKAGDYKLSAEILASAQKKSRLKPKRKIPSRGFPKIHRPLRGRSTFEQGKGT